MMTPTGRLEPRSAWLDLLIETVLCEAAQRGVTATRELLLSLLDGVVPPDTNMKLVMCDVLPNKQLSLRLIQ